MAETQTFEMTPATLARAIANAAARERRRAARLLDDKGDELLGAGDLQGARLMSEMAEAVRSHDAAPAEPAPDPAALGDGDRDYHRADDPMVDDPGDGFAPIRHMDDFEEGAALVRIGADRRGVVGYNGASGHLRD